MKKIIIEGYEYKVGDTVCLIPNNIDENNLRAKDIDVYIIEKITSAGYLYLRHKDNEYRTCKISSKSAPCVKKISPITDAIQSKLEISAYIQKTFKRLKLIKTLNYNQAEAINNILDINGLPQIGDDEN